MVKLLRENLWGRKFLSAVQEKVEQLTTDLTINLVISKAMQILCDQFKVSASDMNVKFTVSVLAPPLEQESRSNDMIDKIKPLKTLELLLPEEIVYDFKIDEVKVLPEGVAAFFGVFFKEENDELVEVEENAKFGTGYVLVIDIGAGTTDVVLIKDTILVQNSRDTFKKGGNTVESIVRNSIKKKFGFSPKNLDSVIKTGVLSEGLETHDVTDILDNARDMYSKSLMEDLRQYLERMLIEMPEIKGILPIGGGSIPSKRGEEIVSKAMSEVLLDYLKRLAPKIQTMSIGNQNPREVNINGLKFMHKYS